MLVHRVPLLLFSGLMGAPHGPLGVLARATRGIHTIPDSVILQQAHALREASHDLREGNDIAPELREPCAADGRVVHLYVLQGHQYCLRRHGHIEQFQKCRGELKADDKSILIAQILSSPHMQILRILLNDPRRNH